MQYILFRSFASSEVISFASCPNNTLQQQAQAAYDAYLRTTVLGTNGSCSLPCQFSILRPKTYFVETIVDWKRCQKGEVHSVVLRMPTTILLTESSFSYTFMGFAAEFGGWY